MLNIDAIHLREINMPLAHPFETSFGLTTGRRICWSSSRPTA